MLYIPRYPFFEALSLNRFPRPRHFELIYELVEGWHVCTVGGLSLLWNLLSLLRQWHLCKSVHVIKFIEHFFGRLGLDLAMVPLVGVP